MRLMLLAMVCGCASAPVRDDALVLADFPGGGAPSAPRAELPDDGDRIASHAESLVGISSLKSVNARLPDDCTGLVRYAYQVAGHELMPTEGARGHNGVTAIWYAARQRKALHRKVPDAGDLVFFRETYDRDRDGRRDDGLTHVGVVESVEPDGTVVFVHRSGKGVTKGRVHPQRPRDRGVNDWLRVRSRVGPAALTGELFAGFASWEAILGAR